VRLDWLPSGCSRAVFSQAKAKGNFQARVHSDQMVLVTIRRDKSQLKLTLSSGKMKNGVIEANGVDE
jgi:hypothetical protein